MVPTPVILANCTAEREVISRHKLIVCLSHVAGDGNELHSSQTDAFFRLPTSNTPAERRARTHEHFRIFTLSGRSVALLREGRRDGGTTLNFLECVTRFRSTSVIAHEEGDVGLSVEVDCAKWKGGAAAPNRTTESSYEISMEKHIQVDCDGGGGGRNRMSNEVVVNCSVLARLCVASSFRAARREKLHTNFLH